MDTIRVSAPAKINLTLDVLDRRPDGYHNLSTIMHEIPLSDDITVNIGGDQGIRAITDVSYIKTDSNIAAKAARLFFGRLEALGRLKSGGIGVLIEIGKKIPVGAGLGGGSADAAAVLKVLNGYFGNPLSQSELIEVGALTGADVPFCIAGGCALCEGIGEIITPQPVLAAGYLVLAKPKMSISTAELFAKYGSSRKQMRPDTSGVIKALSEGDFKGVASRAFNALERAAEKRCGEITEIHGGLLRLGAIGACMSGSGSSVFGLFESETAAQDAYDYYCSRCRDTFLFKM